MSIPVVCIAQIQEKRFFQTLYEVTEPKKTQQKLFHIDKQAGQSNYECPITQK